MSHTVHILATCRSPELLPYTLLVFDSIRVGFPTAEIQVTGNALPDYALKEMTECCIRTNCKFSNGPETIHHLWIEGLCHNEQEQFCLCDTDVIFYESVEGWKFDSALAGWRSPEWDDEFSGCITRARLHPSLLFIDPVKVREEALKYESRIANSPFTPRVNLFYPMVFPFHERPYFYDTLGCLYHAIGGTAFTDQQLGAYFHFNFGSCSDIVLPRLTGGSKLGEFRETVRKNPELGRGLWRQQCEYYKSRIPEVSADVKYPTPTVEEMQAAREFNVRLCAGNQEAMQMNDLYYRMCHGLDDLLDSRRDGRPVMSEEQILELWADTAMFYNSSFYVKYREMLFPTSLLVTNQYADSVAWERSSIHRRRTIADVLRICGDELYFMVAMICGGWKHARQLSPLIRERDWIMQHDKNEQPI